MKKLLKSSLILIFFAISSVLFQISCSEESIAKSNEIVQNKFLYSNYSNNNWEIWIGDVATGVSYKIPIVLPSGTILLRQAILSQDMQIIVFGAQSTSIPHKNYIYSSNLDGSNVKKLVELSSSNEEEFEIHQTF